MKTSEKRLQEKREEVRRKIAIESKSEMIYKYFRERLLNEGIDPIRAKGMLFSLEMPDGISATEKKNLSKYTFKIKVDLVDEHRKPLVKIIDLGLMIGWTASVLELDQAFWVKLS